LVLPADRKRIDSLVEDYLAAVRSRQTEFVVSNELFSLLLRPAIDQESTAKLIVVPDGKLHLLPFDALKDDKGKYVLESHVITYAPSATALHLLRQSRHDDCLASSFLGVGDVIYAQPAIVTSNIKTSVAPKE